MGTKISVTIPRFWNFSRQLRRQVGELLQDFPEELRSAAIMAASELVENAIKYGETVDEADAKIEICLTDSELVIAVTSGLVEPSVFRELQVRLDEIRQSEDVFALYVAKAMESLKNNNGQSQIGLHRIASDGQFRLTATYEQSILTITAVRSLS